MKGLAGEYYWDTKTQLMYEKTVSSKVGPQHDKIVVLTPHAQGEKQQFTLDFFERLVSQGQITKIKTLQEFNEKLNHQKLNA